MKNNFILFTFIVGLLFNGANCFAQSGNVYTVAGGGTSTADGIPATSALLSTTCGIGLDGAGNIYFVDDNHAKIRKVNPSTGLIFTVAGNGTAGFSGDGGPATAAQFGDVRSIWVDATGNIYIADHGNDRVRKVDGLTGVMTTIAGGGSSSADGVAATSADIGEQLCVVLDALGNIYCSGNNSVRRINPSTGIITTVAGGGSSTADGVPATAATISSGVKSISVDAVGDIFIISHDGSPIRKVNGTTGLIYTIAGGGSSSADGIPATASSLSDAHCCRVDASGNLFVSDWNAGKIRRIDAITGIINTIAGGGTSSLEGIPATSAHVHPYQIYLDATGGNIYWADYSSVVRRFSYHPIYGGGTLTGTDSFQVSFSKLCNGPQLTVVTPHFVTGRSVKTYFGDGSTDSSTIAPGFIIGGYTIINHVYQTSGTFPIRQILYNGSVAIDSIVLPYTYTFCRALPVNIFYDENANCVKDGTEPYEALPSITEVDSNGVAVDTISATSGFSYSAYSIPGDIYQFRVISAPGNLTATCPSAGIIADTVQSLITCYPIKYFGLTCTTTASFDLSVNAVVPVTGEHDQWGNIYVRNTYCEPVDATVSLTFSPKYVADDHGWYDISPLPTTIVGNTLTWNITGLSANAASPVDLYYAIWDNPLTGYLTAGDSVQSHYSITPVTGDINTANNVEIVIDTVRASCDPNEMWVNPAGCLPSGSSATQLQYTISFVNTGNDTAFNIYVMDTLPNNVDVKSMNIVMSSAEMFVTRLRDATYGNILKFDFPGINLLDSSHHGHATGAVIFTINTKPGLPDGTQIDNHAGIFFDYNPVVLTNTVENIIGCTGGGPLSASSTAKPNLQIFPNPSTNVLTIKAGLNAYNSLTITNTLGQVLMQQQVNTQQTTIDVKSLPAGMYYITLTGESGIRVEKFVKM